MSKKTNSRVDVYTRVTEQIITAIEAGAGSWEMPWHSNSNSICPVNVETGKRYRGVNIVSLWAASYNSGYKDPIWGTFKQWSDLGCSVNKGEKASIGVFWKPLDLDSDPDQSVEGEATHSRWIARAFPLFNCAQVDGYVVPQRAETPAQERIERAEQFITSLPADIRHGGSKAFYRQYEDFIQMPPYEVFFDNVYYYSTLAHELTHWTAHKSRLDRDLAGRFGSENYAFEELIAELGAAYIAADLELPSDPRTDNAAYIQSWLKVLKGDTKAIFTAASHAQRAADYLHSFEQMEPSLRKSPPAPTL